MKKKDAKETHGTIKEDDAWRVYNFINEWKSGKYGIVTLQKAIDNFLKEEEGKDEMDED